MHIVIGALLALAFSAVTVALFMKADFISGVVTLALAVAFSWFAFREYKRRKDE